MSGIAPVTGTWVNPLIDVTRDEVEAFCRSLHLRPRTDPTNADTAVPAQRHPAARDSRAWSAPSAGACASRWSGPPRVSARTPTS